MNMSDLKNMVREILEEELRSTLSEEEYDIHQDYRAGGLSWEEYQDALASYRRRHPEENPRYGSPRRARPMPRPQGQSAQKASTPAPAADRGTMLKQMVKYKDADGTDREGTVKSLLGYAKDHPGRKAAARVYAQFMAKQVKEDMASVSLQNPAPSTAPTEPDKELDEKSVPEPYNRNSPPRRKMSKGQVEKRDGIGKKMLKNKKVVARFQKKYGQDWKSYLWASASSAALREK